MLLFLSIYLCISIYIYLSSNGFHSSPLLLSYLSTQPQILSLRGYFQQRICIPLERSQQLGQQRYHQCSRWSGESNLSSRPLYYQQRFISRRILPQRYLQNIPIYTGYFRVESIANVWESSPIQSIQYRQQILSAMGWDYLSRNSMEMEYEDEGV